MLQYFRSNYQMLLMFSIWIIGGIFFDIIGFAVIIASIFLLKYKQLYFEMFLGFMLILILSDSRLKEMSFAREIKEIYISLLAIFFLMDRKDFTLFNKIIYFFIPFLLFSVFLISVSDTKFICLRKTISYILLLLIVPNYLMRIYQDKGSALFKEIVFLFTIVLVIGLLFYLFGLGNVSLVGRYKGILGNPNGMGLFCLMFFLLFTTITHCFPVMFLRWEKVFIYVIILISILLSDSRNTIGAILLYFLLVFFFKKSPALGFIIFIVFVLGYELISDNAVTIIDFLGLENYFRIETLETGSGRINAWHFAWKYIQQNFFIGKGFYYDEFVFYQSKESDILSLLLTGHQGGVHNSFLSLWLCTGFIGLLLYFSGFILAFVKASQNFRIAFPLMMAILFSANFESWMMASLNPFTFQMWIILTLLTTPDLWKQKKEEEVLLATEQI
ncbi:MAG: O-antigen ligase family protein [Bacteroidota bacterium]